MTLPVAVAESNGTRSTVLSTKGAVRHCGQRRAVSMADVLLMFVLKNEAVFWVATVLRMGFTAARTAGTTCELAVIWLRADA